MWLRSAFASLVLALYGCDGNYAYDIVSRAASGQVVHRLCNTLAHWAVSFCLAQSLHQLVADVACIQIWEYQYVGMSCNLAVRSLGGADLRNDRSVKL